MRVVYEAENLIDAHLVKGAIEQSGMPAFVRGEHLTGAMGELPVSGLLAVCVPDSCVEEALRIVAEIRAPAPADALEPAGPLQADGTLLA